MRRRAIESNWQPGEMPTMHEALTATLPPRLQRLIRRRPLQPLAAGHGGYYQPKRGTVVPWDQVTVILAAKMAEHDRLPEHLRRVAHGV